MKNGCCKEDGYIVGPRYKIDLDAEGYGILVGGTGRTVKIEPFHYHHETFDLIRPVAGPIRRVSEILPGTRDCRYRATCEQCDSSSRLFVRAGEPSLFRWALAHRCDEWDRNDSDALYRKTRRKY